MHAIDLSDSGIRVESSEAIELHTDVYRARRAIRVDGQYHGTPLQPPRVEIYAGARVSYGVRKAADAAETEVFVDYYELLQISPNAEPETIHRVFRIMASRYHPDNKETGDNEKFLLLTKAYAILSDPARRASPTIICTATGAAQPLPVFGLKEFAEGLEGEVNRRLGILSLLYNRRRTNPENPGISLLEFETVMSFPREHLEFAIWFLREKQYIRTGNNSDYYIAAAGVEYLESEVPSKGILSKLLHAAQSQGCRRDRTGNQRRHGRSRPCSGFGESELTMGNGARHATDWHGTPRYSFNFRIRVRREIPRISAAFC